MKKSTVVLGCLVVVKFALQYVLINPVYELHRDEFLHLDQARHLAWGYISVPPMSSWIAFLIRLLGNGEFWIKFFPALFGVLTMVLAWKIAGLLGGRLFAKTIAGLAILLSVILRINILFQPNSTDIFFWTAVYYALIRYIMLRDPRWLYVVAVLLAAGFYSKYNIGFLFIGLVPALVLSPHRGIFAERHFYLAALLGLLLISPNLAWQYQNHFPTLMQLRELAATQLVHVSRIGFVKDQALFFVSSLFILLAGMASFFLYPPFKTYRFIFTGFVISFLVFVFLRAKSYYAIGLYPVLLAFGSVYWEAICSRKRLVWLRPASFAVMAVLAAPFIALGFPWQSPAGIEQHSRRYAALGLLTWEDGRIHSLPQDFADMQGWKELAEKTDSAFRRLHDPFHTLVLCDNYGEAGAVNYYAPGRDIHAVSFNADYINWFPLDSAIRNIVLVRDPENPDSSMYREQQLFDSVALAGRITNPYAREKGAAIYILQGPRVNINAVLEKEILRRLRNRN